MTFNTANNVYHTREGEVWLKEPGSDEKYVRALNRDVSLKSIKTTREVSLWLLVFLAMSVAMLIYGVASSQLAWTVSGITALALFWPLTLVLLFSWLRERWYRERKVRATVYARTSTNIRSGDSLTSAYSVYVLCALQPSPPNRAQRYWSSIRSSGYDFEWYDLDMKFLNNELTPEQERDFKLEVINTLADFFKEFLPELQYQSTRGALVRQAEHDFLSSQPQHVEDLTRLQEADAAELARQRALLEQVRANQTA